MKVNDAPNTLEPVIKLGFGVFRKLRAVRNGCYT
jgi:hypothetical protein